MPRSRKLFEGLDEAVVVALMKADGGLVEDVEHAAEAGADLGGKADALALAAGEGGGVAVEGKIAEADGAEEFEALDDFAANALGDQGFARGEGEVEAAERARLSGREVKSAMERPPILTASDSGRRRFPRQAGQGVADMKLIMYSR